MKKFVLAALLGVSACYGVDAQETCCVRERFITIDETYEKEQCLLQATNAMLDIAKRTLLKLDDNAKNFKGSTDEERAAVEQAIIVLSEFVSDELFQSDYMILALHDRSLFERLNKVMITDVMGKLEKDFSVICGQKPTTFKDFMRAGILRADYMKKAALQFLQEECPSKKFLLVDDATIAPAV